jgi:histone deacetylase 6
VHRYDRGSYYPCGPGGNFPNCGVGEAEGTKLNIPLNIISKKRKRYDFQAHGDNEYVYLYNRIIHPILEEFDPQFILVSSGFDAARKDYLGGFTVTPNGYFYITRRLQEFNRPVLCVLEGGYHLGSTAQAATAVVRGLLEE